MARIDDDYGSFQVSAFTTDGEQQHDEDFDRHADAMRRFRELAGRAGLTDVQVFGWLRGTNEPQLLKSWDDGSTDRKRPKQAEPPKPPAPKPRRRAIRRQKERHWKEVQKRHGLPNWLLNSEPEPQPPQVQGVLFGR
jgi:hypothetical protein